MPNNNIPMAEVDLGSQRAYANNIDPGTVNPMGEMDVARTTAHNYRMAVDTEQSKMLLENQADAANDKLRMDIYEKSKPDDPFLSPDSIQTAMTDLKGKLSRNGMANLSQLYLQRKLSTEQVQTEMANKHDAALKDDADQIEFNAQYLYQPGLDAYNSTMTETGGNKTKALQALNSSLQASAKVAAQLKKRDGTPVFPPEAIQNFTKVNTPEQLAAVVAHTKYRTGIIKAELESRKGESEITKNLATARKEDALAKNGGSGGEMPSVIPPQDQGKSGEDYLKTLPPSQAKEVKALAEGRLPISPYALRSKQMWPLIERAMQYDPNFDASNYQVRVRERQADTTSLANLTKQADMVMAFESTAEKNLDMLVAQSKKLPRSSWPIVNRAVLKGKLETGDPETAKFYAIVTPFVNEYAKILSGQTGAAGASDTSRAEAASILSPYFNADQIDKLAPFIRQEMQNRTNSLEAQRVEIKKRVHDSSANAKPSETEAAPGNDKDIDAILKKHGVK